MKKYFALALVLAHSIFATAAFAGAYDELTKPEQDVIQNGKQLMKLEDVKNSEWPKMYLYQRVDATPEETAAVLMDYELQPTYIKGMLKAKISRVISKTAVEVDYEIQVPVLSNENTTVENRVSIYDHGASYRFDTRMIKAYRAKSGVGNMRIEQLGTGTLIAFYHFVVPDTSFAGLIRDQVIKQTGYQFGAMIKQVEKERRDNQPLLQKQIAALRRALAPSNLFSYEHEHAESEHESFNIW